MDEKESINPPDTLVIGGRAVRFRLDILPVPEEQPVANGDYQQTIIGVECQRSYGHLLVQLQRLAAARLQVKRESRSA